MGFVPASELYDVHERTSLPHPAEQADISSWGETS